MNLFSSKLSSLLCGQVVVMVVVVFAVVVVVADDALKCAMVKLFQKCSAQVGILYSQNISI